jgi:hypothetical protein
LSPHDHSEPSRLIPTDANLLATTCSQSPPTWVGMSRRAGSIELSPSSPNVLAPQAQSVPSSFKARLCDHPAETVCQLDASATRRGTGWGSVKDLLWSPPQDQREPSARMESTCDEPAETTGDPEGAHPTPASAKTKQTPRPRLIIRKTIVEAPRERNRAWIARPPRGHRRK